MLTSSLETHSIADIMPQPHPAPVFAEGHQQAVLGSHEQPSHTEKQPLRLFVHESHDGDKMRLVANEGNTLIDRLPIATKDSKPSSQATDDDNRSQSKLINLWYTVDAPDSSEQPSNEIGDEILKHINAQPTTVMVTNARREKDGPPGFKSPANLANVVDRVFGGCVKHLILNSWFESYNTLEDIYWPHTAQTWDDEMTYTKPTFTTNHPFNQLFITPDRALHINPIFYHEHQVNIEKVYLHLLKFRELLDAAQHLQSIQLQLHTYCWDEILLTRVKATNRDGVLWVDWNDVQVGFLHTFVEAGNRRRRSGRGPPLAGKDGSYAPRSPE